ncbi:hypothetical protein LCM23_06430 [Cytobacillus kochii]|uniref:hypothetical protein n=1 Tax=Cytobacillus kochii TaxID=859143 RepID=UPI001CD72ACF|nr:hypothetical protein [Cytobacillus kochii]MCA1025722.1 hypothetical protein [Cytobacillus kochii]
MEKPQVKHVTFIRSEGKYDWLHPNEVSANYYFNIPHLSHEELKELNITTNYLVDLDKDYSCSPESYTPLELAYELKDIYNSYWIHSSQKEIERLIEFLEGIEEEQVQLRHEHSIENAKYQIHYWEMELDRLNELY